MLHAIEVVQYAGNVYHRATKIDVEVVIACACAMMLVLVVHGCNVVATVGLWQCGEFARRCALCRLAQQCRELRRCSATTSYDIDQPFVYKSTHDLCHVVGSCLVSSRFVGYACVRVRAYVARCYAREGAQLRQQCCCSVRAIDTYR